MMKREEVLSFCQFLVQNRRIVKETALKVLGEFDNESTTTRFGALRQPDTTPRAGAILIVQELARYHLWLGADCEPIAVAEHWLIKAGISDTVAADPRPATQPISARVERFPGAQQAVKPAEPKYKRFGDKIVPAKLGDFVIEKPLGEGGMGAVFLARNVHTGLRVALKVMADALVRGEPNPPDPDAVREANERFRREAITCMSLSSPHIVRGYHLGEDDDVLYLVMELIPGQDLGKFVKTLAPDDTTTVIRLMRDVARGVGEFHAKRFIHRDIKPGNVMVDASGCPKVIDSGLVRSLDGADVMPAKLDTSKVTDAQLTATGTTLGTPAFMSPEQAMSTEVGAPSDVFSLGKMLVFLLTGEQVHPGRSSIEIFRMLLEQTELPATIVSAVKRRLPFGGASKRMLDIINKTLAMQPGDRYQDAGQLAKALDDFLTWQVERKAAEAEAQTQALEDERKAREEQQRVNRRLLIVLGIACLFSLMLVLMAIFFAQARKAAEQAEAQAQARATAESQAAESARQAEAEQRLHVETSVQFLECQTLIKACRWEDAERALLTLIGRDPSYEVAHYTLGQVQFNLRKAECVDQWEWLIQHGNVQRRSEYAFYALLVTDQLRPLPSVADYDPLLARINDAKYLALARAELAFDQAERASRSNQTTNAVQQLLAVLDGLPRLEDAGDIKWLVLAYRGGVAWRVASFLTGSEKTARLVEARLCLQSSVALNPDFPMTWFWLGDVVRLNNDFATAVAIFERLQCLMPNWAPPRYLRMDAMLEQSFRVNDADFIKQVSDEAVTVCHRVLDTFHPEPRQALMARLTLFKALLARFNVAITKRDMTLKEQARADLESLAEQIKSAPGALEDEIGYVNRMIEQVRTH